MLVKPRSTFAYLRDHSGWSWLWPLGVALVLALVVRFVAAPLERAEADRALAQLQKQLEEQGLPEGDQVVFGAPGGVIGAPLGATGPNPLLEYGLPLSRVVTDWLLTAAILLGLAWLLGGRPTFGALVSVSGWALLPAIVRQLVQIGVMTATGQVPLPGLSGMFLSPQPENAAVAAPGVAVAASAQVGLSGPSFLSLLQQSFLSAADVYTLWWLALLVIGVAVTARLGWLRSLTATAVFAGLWLALATLPGLLSFLLLPLLGSGSFILR